jgi:nucleoside-triphosphatase THEP1
MKMGKDSINVKSNGLRNELKEINKSLKQLIAVLERQTAQTNEHDEKRIYTISTATDNRMWSATNTSQQIE